jgi:hypothetical protein
MLILWVKWNAELATGITRSGLYKGIVMRFARTSTSITHVPRASISTSSAFLRNQAKCYNPSKPAKWHLKVYALNCAATSYQIRFFMYEGRTETHPADMSATV